MTAGRFRHGARAALLGLALLAAPALAIERFPGETDAAFSERAQEDQQRKLAAADAASGGPFSALTGGSDSGSMGGGLKIGLISLAMLALGGLRTARGLLNASRGIAKVSGKTGPRESFEERLAERLRELEREAPSAGEASTAMPLGEGSSTPRAQFNAGPRTFGRRVS